MHEASLYSENSFVTLTYDPARLPSGGSLDKTAFPKFMKRLRKQFGDRRVRYYHCGEYGEELQRPHYHAVLFNASFSDKELLQEKNGCFLFTSHTLQKLWPDGFVTVGEVTYQSAAYVSRYVLKKVTGDRAHDHYLRVDEYGQAYWLEPEYVTMSLKPGIGAEWYERYQNDFFPSDETPIPGKGTFKGVPRYYEEALRRSDPELWKQVKEGREAYKREHGRRYTAKARRDSEKVTRARLALNPRSTF